MIMKKKSSNPPAARRQNSSTIDASPGSPARWRVNLLRRSLVPLLLLASAPLLYAPVERSNHGSIGHADMGAFRHVPVEQHHVMINRGPDVRHELDLHQHVDVDVDRGRYIHRGFFPGGVVTTLPFGFQTFYVGGAPYYYSEGSYYQPDPSGYMAVAPPMGAAVPALPADAVPVAYNGQTLYFADGVCYQQSGNNFTIVPVPIGLIAPELPAGATQVVSNGAIYYQYNGVLYQPVIANGVTEYQAVAPR
jgi:hypothetical protein